jgi:NAD(P)-dependent dehydrogenase (short-subunit alcohol dehydrogenase family)
MLFNGHSTTWDLRGKTVLITGAARGIGAESARTLASRGANLALVGLEPDELARVAEQCGPATAWFECDVTDWQALERATAGAVERFGGIDAVVANAGIAPTGLARSMDPRAFERTLEVNLLGVWRTVRTSLPLVIARQGYVLVISSLAAAVHGAGMAPYSASKAGVEAFADSLRIEVKHLGVDVGVGYFSFIDTDMVRGADAHPAARELRQAASGPFGRSYPVSAVGKAIADGIEKRSRWVVVPGWSRALLVLRTAIAPLMERQAFARATEADRLFEQDIERRGAEAASAPVGPGGTAARERAGRETGPRSDER